MTYLLARWRQTAWTQRPALVTLAALAGLSVLAAAVFAPAFGILPVGGDNLYVLSWADRTPASGLYRVDPLIYPEWRPLAYLTVWLQYRGLGPLEPYFLFNLLALTLCGWFVFRLVNADTGSLLASGAASALALTDPRVVRSVTWIVERQSSLACLFGLMALARVSSLVRHDERGGRSLVGVAALLVASALSKEYGLAFAAAIAVQGALCKRRDLALIASGAVVLYAAARLLTVSGAASSTCLSSGFFFEERVLCADSVGLTLAPQAIYNAVASLVGTVVPGVLASNGVVGLSVVRLVIGVVCFQFALVGWWHATPLVRTALMVAVFNALLNFMLYRDRNQFCGVFAFAIAIGSGVAWAERRTCTVAGRALALRPVLAVLLVAVVSLQSVRSHSQVVASREEMRAADQCPELLGGGPVDADFVRRVNRVFGLPDPECDPRTDEAP
ncbi:MAG: hypothetical protein ABL982_11605 [Vicinamibacterales bacterium]